MRSTLTKAKTRTAPAAGHDREDLAVRFVNTAAWRLRAPREERLPDADALLAWLASNGIGDTGRLQHSAIWNADAKARQGVYDTAIAVREAIYEILVARIGGNAPPHAALKLFNQCLAHADAEAGIAWRNGALVWDIGPHSDALALLKPVIVSAGALMTGPRAARLKQCQDDRGCGWLFVDDSRAQNRRWCSMGDCGNRAKAHRHYDRLRRKARE